MKAKLISNIRQSWRVDLWKGDTPFTVTIPGNRAVVVEADSFDIPQLAIARERGELVIEVLDAGQSPSSDEGSGAPSSGGSPAAPQTPPSGNAADDGGSTEGGQTGKRRRRRN